MKNPFAPSKTLSGLTLLVLALADPAPAQPTYTIQRLAGLQNSSVARISDAGHVVAGQSVWYQGTLTDVGGLGGNFTAVEDVNASGQVVGRSRAADGYMRAFVWQNGVMTALPNLGGEEGFATAINNAGQIVGYTDNIPGSSVGGHRATFWTATHQALDIGTVSPDNASRAHAINNLGQAAGVSLPNVAAGFGHDAFFWNGNSITAFLTNRDSSAFEIKGLNDQGQVVGRLASSGFVWQNGVLTMLGVVGGTSTLANSINNEGQIVGRVSLSGGVAHAYLFEAGQALDLNNLVPDLSEWEALSVAYDINAGGQIVGLGKFRGSNANELFLLTPVPEPSTAVLLLLGAMVLARQSPRR